MENKEINKLIEEFGKEVVAEMQQELIENGDIASGNLYRSLKVEVQTSIKETIVRFLSLDYGIDVDKGREPGKFPPISKIKEWTKLKGIPEKAAFPIAKKIYKFGIAPKPFIFDSFNKKKTAFVKKLADVYSKSITSDIKKDFISSK